MMRTPLLLILALFITTSVFAQKKKKKGEEPKEEKQEYFLDKLGNSALKFRSIGPALTSGRISDFKLTACNL